MRQEAVIHPGRFVKKPVPVEAMYWDGTNSAEVMRWAGEDNFFIDGSPHRAAAKVYNSEERYWCDVPEIPYWIIKGIKGEFYPCSPYIFEETYHPVPTSPSSEKRETWAGLRYEP